MADKYNRISGSGLIETAGTVTSAGVGNAGNILALDANGLIDPSCMPSGITPDQITANANGAITAKDLVYMETAGTIARATAAAGTPHRADGWATTSVTTGQPVVMQLEGKIVGLTGLTVGARYFLSNTVAGGLTATPPSATGELWQYIGTAMSTTVLNFEPDDAIQRA